MKARLVIVVLFVVATAVGPPASWAFKPYIHTDITQEVLKTIERDVGGQRIHFTDAARKEVVQANEATDKIRNQASEEYHFDDEAFTASSERLLTLREEIVDALSQPCPQGFTARQKLGTALHTLQDFYSHSNWVNLHGMVINPKLGTEVFGAPDPKTRTCKEDQFTLLPGLQVLTTSYFPLEHLLCLDVLEGKCRHGSTLVVDCPEGLNKDEPSRPFHAEARALAVEATRVFVDQILDDPRVAESPRALATFLVANHDLVVVLDTTASMEPYHEALVAEVSRRTLFDRFMVMTFGDPLEVRYTNLCDPSQLPPVLSAVELFGGGGAEEPAARALVYALREARAGAEVLLATDAPAKDCPTSWASVLAYAERGHLRFSTPAVAGLLPLGAVCTEFGQLPTADLRKKSLEGAPDDGPRWLDFSAVELRGRLWHEGLFPLDGMPIAGAPTQVRARFEGAAQVSFRLVSPEGAVLGPLDLRAGAPDAAQGDYVGSLAWPTRPFRVQAYGRDLAGRPFTQTYDWTFRGQKVTVVSTTGRPYAPPGGRVVVEFQVDNRGPAATFAFDAHADGGAGVSGIDPGQLALGRTAKGSFRVTVEIPAEAQEGSVVTLLATAAAPDRPGLWNYGTAEILVTANRPPVCPAPRERPRLQPADGRMVPLDVADVAGVRDPDRDPLHLAVISITQDEPVTPPRTLEPPAADGEGLGQATVELRAEREKRGNGRVYRVGYVAIDPKGFSCTGHFEAIVPPTGRSETAVDDGQNHDSTRP